MSASARTTASVYPAHAVWTAALGRVRRQRAVILGYHGVADCPRRDDEHMLQLRPAKFRAQLDMMVSAGFRFVTVAELAHHADGAPPPPGLSAVSFDDALRNNLTTALPILLELGIPATVYVPTDWLGGRSPWLGPDGDGAIMTADDLRELVRAGWELGVHTRTHADMSTLSYDDCRREIEDCCRVLSEISGTNVQTLAYPFGRYGPQAIEAARDAGLLAAVSTGSAGWKPYELPRAMIGAADPFAIVLLKMTGHAEPLLRHESALRVVRRATEHVRGRAGERRREPVSP